MENWTEEPVQVRGKKVLKRSLRLGVERKAGSRDKVLEVAQKESQNK